MTQSPFESELIEILGKYDLKYQLVNYGENRIDGLGQEDSKLAQYLADINLPPVSSYEWRTNTYDGTVVCFITTGGLFGTGLFSREVAQVFGVPTCESVEIVSTSPDPKVEKKLDNVVREIQGKIPSINLSYAKYAEVNAEA